MNPRRILTLTLPNHRTRAYPRPPTSRFKCHKKKQTAGIILAAGASTRFGQPKQLLKLKNKYLLEWVLDAALASRLQSVVLVLGHEHHKILQALGIKTNHPHLQVEINHRYLEGQSRSLQAGLLKVRQAFSLSHVSARRSTHVEIKYHRPNDRQIPAFEKGHWRSGLQREKG